MSTAISIRIFPDAEKWLRENVPSMESDSVSCVRPRGPFKPRGKTEYEDLEEGTTKLCSFQDHVRALQLLCEQVGSTLFVGGIKSPRDLEDPCNWDAEVVDAYWQLVYYGKVIYG